MVSEFRDDRSIDEAKKEIRDDLEEIKLTLNKLIEENESLRLEIKHLKEERGGENGKK